MSLFNLWKWAKNRQVNIVKSLPKFIR